MVRIKPKEVKKTGKVPTNGSIFFTIFQFHYFFVFRVDLKILTGTI
jgi:hypothetical protein